MSTVVLRKPEGRRRATVELYAAEDSTAIAYPNTLVEMLEDASPQAGFPQPSKTMGVDSRELVEGAVARAAQAAHAVGRAYRSVVNSMSGAGRRGSNYRGQAVPHENYPSK